MKRITITGILLAMFAGACLYEASAQTAVTLTGTSYTNAFDNLTTEGFPPAEWATRTAASATAVGTIYAWNTANSSPTNYWALTSGRFANQASAYSYGSAYSGATNFVGTESRQIQTNEPNRCMALRQTSSVGDPGGAFCFKIAETANRKDFHFYVDLLNLDTAPTRTTVWTVDYGLGDTPSSFVPVATWTNTPLIFTRYATNITFPNGTIDNIGGTVWIRIVALTASTGSGSRETFAIDNAGLTWAPGVACTPVSITGNPSPVSGYINGNASFTVGAVGTAPRSYQWLQNGTTVLMDDGHFSGTTTPTLSITTLQLADAGTYSCIVSNVCDSTLYSQTSLGAALTVSAPPSASIGYLRTLVDPTTWAPTNTALLYTATGIITTYTNTTTANTASYYLQDGTGGINLFCTFGSTWRPMIGDVVTAVGPLGLFANNLELLVNLTDPAQSVTILSNNIAGYPAPIVVPWTDLYQFGTNASLNYNVAGSIVLLTNVYFGPWAGTVTTNGNYNMVVTNSLGQSARVLLPAQMDNDLTNRTIPSLPCTVKGPLVATATGYQVMPTLWSDITETVAPAVSVTVNSITSTGISYSGGSGTQFVLLESADATQPLSSWTRAQTNSATPGSFAISTTGAQKFYSIKSE